MAQNELPARGQFPKLKLGKKVPKKADALLIAAFEGEGGLELPGTELLGAAALRSTYEALVAVGASGTAGEVTRVPAPAKAGVASIIAVGLGEAEEVDDETLRRAAGQAARSINKIEQVATSLGDFGIAPVVEGLILGGYKYSGLRSESATAPTTFTWPRSQPKRNLKTRRLPLNPFFSPAIWSILHPTCSTQKATPLSFPPKQQRRALR